MKKRKTLLVLFIIISLLLVAISYRAFTKISNFKEHRDYIVQPVKDQKIMDWMTLNYLEKTFWINLEKALWNNISFSEKRLQLSEYCSKNNLNCPELILSLEKYKNGN